MVGTIIASSGTAFSTAGNVNVVTLNGRALVLIASLTLVNTVINVPATAAAKIGVQRNGFEWYLDLNGNGIWNAGIDATYSFGVPGDVRVTGDWNGTGKTMIGIVRNGFEWYLDMNGNGVWDAGDVTHTFGIPGDVPVTGDWNGSGTTKVGVVRNGFEWFLMVRVDQIDQHYEHVKRSNATILQTPQDFPYGERQHVVEAPGGHRWTFSQTMSDVAPGSRGGVLFE